MKMAKIKSGFCKECQERTKLEKGGASHIPHLIMTILTGGLWLIIWLFACVTGQWRCSVCGSNKLKKVY